VNWPACSVWKKGQIDWRVSYLYLSTCFLTKFADHNIRKRTMVAFFEVAPGELYLAELDLEQEMSSMPIRKKCTESKSTAMTKAMGVFENKSPSER